MADRTLQILPGGQSPAPFTYSVPASTSFTLLAVRAVLDGTAAAGAFLPCVQLVSDAGVVMAETIGDSVAAGDSADASFFPLRRKTAPIATGTFAQTVLTIAVANSLRGYWRLGEVAAPMADSSGWSGGPTPLTVSGVGAAPTFHITGALPFGQDDGAIQINGGAGTGEYLANGSGAVNTGINTGFTIAAWINPTSSLNSWLGGIYNNQAVSGGVLNGWALSGNWSAGAIDVRLNRWIAGVRRTVAAVIGFGVWIFVVVTYDGANMRMYINGALSATTADARADTFDPYFNVAVGVNFADTSATSGSFLGGLDEVAVWGTVLTPGQIADLYAAAQI